MPPEYTIKGVYLTEAEAILVSFVLFGLNYKEAALCMGLEHGTVKNKMHKIESSCGVHNLHAFRKKASDSGFDDRGHYNKRPLLTEHHYRLIRRHAPRVFFDK